MRRTLPSVRCLTRRSAASRSSGSRIVRSASRAAAASSNSSWHVFSSTRLKVIGLSSPAAGGNCGSSRDSARHRSAYIATNVGCATAFSNTIAIVCFSTSAVATTSSSWFSRRSNFSGVSLFSTPLIWRSARSVPDTLPPGL